MWTLTVNVLVIGTFTSHVSSSVQRTRQFEFIKYRRPNFAAGSVLGVHFGDQDRQAVCTHEGLCLEWKTENENYL